MRAAKGRAGHGVWISLSEWVGVEREEEVARLKRHVWAGLWASVHPPDLELHLGGHREL